MKIKISNIRDQVFFIIKEMIFKKEYKLGENINIQELTRKLEVSNTPIREALSSLNALGLIDVSENYKYKVISLSEKEITDLNESILILILGSLELIEKRDRINILESMLEKAYTDNLKKYEENQNFDYEYIRTSINFDRQFVLATENKYLIKEFNDLADLLILTSIYNKDIYREIHLEEHRLMLESIKTKDFYTTRTILRNHFNKKIKDMDYE